jgi:hypothetical protein
MTEARSEERPRTPTDDELPALLVELEAAGGSVSGFARERGLAPWKLYEARQGRRGSTKRKRKNSRRGDLVPVRVVDRATAAARPLELVLSSGHRLVIPTEFDETSLRRLMGILASC